jgi:hypothetical protein
MITSKASIAAVVVSLFLLFAAAAQADETDQISISAKGSLSPEGWAKMKFSYSCAPRVGTTSMVSNATQDYPNSDEWVASFERYSEPLTCDGEIHKTRIVHSGDLIPYAFVPGAARVEASFWNDVLGHYYEPTGFGPLVDGTVVLR